MARKEKKNKGKGGYKGLSRDLGKASALANEYLDLSPLSTVDAGRAPETSNYLASLQALSDPTYGSYAGARTPEMQAFMQRYQDSTQGYNSQELNALREQRRREVERGFQGGRAALARGQNNYRVGATQRGAQLLDLAKTYGQQSTDAEQDLFVRNADEQQRRLENYGTFARDLGQQEFERGGYAREQYGKALADAQANELDRQKINLSQESASKAIQEAGKLGIFQIAEARRNAKRQNRLMRQLEAMRSRRSAPSSNSTTNYYVDALNNEADRLAGGA